MNVETIIGMIAALSWLAVLAGVGILVLRSSRQQSIKGMGWIIVLLLVLAVAINGVSAGLVFIEPTERGVVITIASGGVREDVLQPGLNWVIPFAESVVTYPIIRQTYTMSGLHTEGQITGDDSVEARTSDGQVVFVAASVIFEVDPTHVVNLHINWQNNYVDGLIRPLARGIIRDTVSQFGIEEVYSLERFTLTELIAEELAVKMEDDGLVLVDFILRSLSFSEEYGDSIEQKQIAEQLAQQAAFVVEQRKQEAEQARQVSQGQADAAVIIAEGDAEALILTAEAEAEARVLIAEAEAEALGLIGAVISNNPDLLTYEYIQALAPNITVMLLPADAPFLFPLPQLDSVGGME